MSFVSKPGKHGTLYQYLLRYKDKDDPASPTFDWKTWAYDSEHALDKFYDSDDEGWKIVSWERVKDGAQHRARRHDMRESHQSEDELSDVAIRALAAVNFAWGMTASEEKAAHEELIPGGYVDAHGTWRLTPKGVTVLRAAVEKGQHSWIRTHLSPERERGRR